MTQTNTGLYKSQTTAGIFEKTQSPINQTANQSAASDKSSARTSPKDGLRFYQNPLLCEAKFPETFEITDDYKPDYLYIQEKLGEYKTVPMNFDASKLNPKDRRVLVILIKVSEYLDQIYFRQIHRQNKEIHAQLKARASSSAQQQDKDALAFFEFNHGPSDLYDKKTFIGSFKCSPGCNFYPEDMNKEEFENWIKNHPEDKKAFTSPYTVIRRENGKLIARPYQAEYADLLEPAAQFLKEAAGITDNESLKNYFLTLHDAFLTKKWPESDKAWGNADRAWMGLKDTPFEAMIAPQEVYRDDYFNYKSAAETYIVLRDTEKEKDLKKFSEAWPKLKKYMPIDDRLKQEFGDNFSCPPEIGQEIYNAGDAKRPIAMGFSLPNNSDVINELGSKKVMLINIIEAKFESAFIPIAKELLDPKLYKYIDSKECFNAYFDWILSHELSHGTVPKKDIYEHLKERASAIEETKGDVLGMYYLLRLINEGNYPKERVEYLMTNYLAENFRSIQWGSQQAHRTGALIQFNWMIEKGVFIYDEKTKRYSIDTSEEGLKKFENALSGLVKELLEIEASGSYERAGALIKIYGTIKPPYLQESLNIIKGMVKDIIPKFEINNL